MKETQLWYVSRGQVDANGRFIGAVIYEESGNNMVKLSFVTSRIEEEQGDVESSPNLDYPQE